MTAYTDFVRQHIHRAPGATQKEKMKAVAAAWRKRKGGVKGRGVDEPGPSAIEGGGARRHKKMRGGDVMEGGGDERQRVVAPAGVMHGGMVDLRPANQLTGRGSSAAAVNALLGGCATCDQADMAGTGIIQTIGHTLGAIAPLAPLAMALL